MAADASNIEALKAKIGVEREVGTYEIEKGMIRKFARAIGDANPRWQDEANAVNRQYGNATAPPTMMLTIGLGQIEQELAVLPSMAILHGSTEMECHQAVKAGDNISVTIKLANLRERSGRDNSTMVFMIFELIYKNQRQDLVATCRQTLIGY